MDWRDDALCKGKHRDIWYPPHKEERTAPESHYNEIAKMVCNSCPVRKQCEKEGEAEDHGVWGGWSAKERKHYEFRPSKRILPIAHISIIPDHRSDQRLDIAPLRDQLKKYTERRVV